MTYDNSIDVINTFTNTTKSFFNFFEETPQSTNICVFSVFINEQFPELPLYKLQNLNISTSYSSVTLSIVAPNFLNLSSICSYPLSM